MGPVPLGRLGIIERPKRPPRTAGGETVLITDRDRVVAELVPPRAGRSPALADGVLAEAVRRGWVTPPLGGAEGPPQSLAAAPLAALVAELRADRDAR